MNENLETRRVMFEVRTFSLCYELEQCYDQKIFVLTTERLRYSNQCNRVDPFNTNSVHVTRNLNFIKKQISVIGIHPS